MNGVWLSGRAGRWAGRRGHPAFHRHGGGSWITNKDNGYYIGRAMPGTTFDDEVTDSANWHFGRAFNPDMCGWVMPGSMGALVGTVADSCSTTTMANLAHRLTVGRDFNALAHHATDPVLGWGFVPIGGVNRPSPVFNDND